MTNIQNENLNSQESQVLTVEGLNRQVRQLVEGNLGLVWVQGEISNFKAHTSGHHYFSLKDSKSQISAVMFRGFNSRLKFKIEDGLEVIVRGRISVYEPRGSYQIVCETMEPVGAGALQKAFEQLKLKLKSEGLFESQRKRPLPSLPRHIAIVTSPTGAAIRDILNILARRNRGVPVTLVPTLVQGEGAAQQIIEALQKAIRLPEVDVIIVGRGGGSIEDLWAFNDEALARAIASCPVPVISAVGHEIDFTIADFVADLRAPTPSAAAELVVKNVIDLTVKIENLIKLLKVSMQRVLQNDHRRLQLTQSRLVDPRRTLQDFRIKNDDLINRLQLAIMNRLSRQKLEVRALQESLTPPEVLIQGKRKKVDMAQLKMENLIKNQLISSKNRFQKLTAILDSLSPLKVVERGYSLVTYEGELIKKSEQLKVNDHIKIQLMKGQVTAKVTEIQ